MKSKEIIEILKRLQHLETLSTRLLGGWLPGVEHWEAKHILARHLWEDAQHSKELRTRLWELRVPAPDKSIRGNTEPLKKALASSPSDLSFLTAHYLVVKQAILKTYREISETTYQVYDAPTVSTVSRIIPEKQAQIDWADQALRQLLDSGDRQRESNRWMAYIESVLEADGGVSGEPQQSATHTPTRPPATHLLQLPFAEARRDKRFRLHFTGMDQPEEEDKEGQRLYQFVNYAHEMQAAETLGSVLWETEEMEWEFYFDLARHCYDEARHAHLGETRLKELGYHITDFPHCVTNYNWRQLYDPLTRYCMLTYVIESDSFKYKHKTYQHYLSMGDLESAEAVLYDITDETLHVRWGQKWVPKLMEKQACKKDLEDLVTECRQILLKHSVTSVQKEYAKLASADG